MKVTRAVSLGYRMISSLSYLSVSSERPVLHWLLSGMLSSSSEEYMDHCLEILAYRVHTKTWDFFDPKMEIIHM